ncbi:unnamed protein product, partial [Lymnaea stagnalis]
HHGRGDQNGSKRSQSLKAKKNSNKGQSQGQYSSDDSNDGVDTECCHTTTSQTSSVAPHAKQSVVSKTPGRFFDRGSSQKEHVAFQQVRTHKVRSQGDRSRSQGDRSWSQADRAFLEESRHSTEKAKTRLKHDANMSSYSEISAKMKKQKSRADLNYNFQPRSKDKEGDSGRPGKEGQPGAQPGDDPKGKKRKSEAGPAGQRRKHHHRKHRDKSDPSKSRSSRLSKSQDDMDYTSVMDAVKKRTAELAQPEIPDPQAME